MSLGFLSHCKRLYDQVQCCQHTFLSGIMISNSENGPSLNQGPLDPSNATKLATVPCRGGYCQGRLLLRLWELESDWGSKCTDEDQSEETKEWALISAITFCPQWHFITSKARLLLSCESLALQDYHYTTVPCLGVEACGKCQTSS